MVLAAFAAQPILCRTDDRCHGWYSRVLTSHRWTSLSQDVDRVSGYVFAGSVCHRASLRISALVQQHRPHHRCPQHHVFFERRGLASPHAPCQRGVCFRRKSASVLFLDYRRATPNDHVSEKFLQSEATRIEPFLNPNLRCRLLNLRAMSLDPLPPTTTFISNLLAVTCNPHHSSTSATMSANSANCLAR